MNKPSAIAVHGFAGGFTQGVQDYFDVKAQMEVHGLGLETVQEVLKVPVNMKGKGEWDRPLPRGLDFVFGNPRCSCFSNMCTHSVRGEDAKQIVDINDWVGVARKAKPAVAAFESVQQALTTGRPAVARIAQTFIDGGYRVFHLMYSNGSFGVPQVRKRYLFVAVRKGLPFNIELPRSMRQHTVGDVLGRIKANKAGINKQNLEQKSCTHYDHLAHSKLSDEWEMMIPAMEQNQGLNDIYKTKGRKEFVKRGCKRLTATIDRFEAKNKGKKHGSLVFGLNTNGAFRIANDRPCQVIHMGCTRLVHPTQNRTLTVEELCALMRWWKYPIGSMPGHQIGRGVAPPIGSWIAGAAADSLRGRGGGDDLNFGGVDPECVQTNEYIVNFNHLAPHRKCNHE